MPALRCGRHERHSFRQTRPLHQRSCAVGFAAVGCLAQAGWRKPAGVRHANDRDAYDRLPVDFVGSIAVATNNWRKLAYQVPPDAGPLRILLWLAAPFDVHSVRSILSLHHDSGGHSQAALHRRRDDRLFLNAAAGGHFD